MRFCSPRLYAAAAVLLFAAAASAQAVYDPQKALAWVQKTGCNNATMSTCPGGRQCTDAEFYARALAAGGVVDLNPDDLGRPYLNYKGYNLEEANGLLALLPFLGFDQSTGTNYPVGSILWTIMWPPGMPYFAVGGNLCDSHTPLLQGGPHCSIVCSYLRPRVAFVPNGKPVDLTGATGTPPPTPTPPPPPPGAPGTYDAAKALAWVQKTGCNNASITNCPGGRECTDAEFYARALAAGGVVNLNPDDPSADPYHDYKGFILAEATGLINILPYLGFTQVDASTITNYPVGSIVWTVQFPPGMPYFADGNNLCDSHTPVVNGGPHCSMPCTFFNPRIVFVPNGQLANVPAPLPPATGSPATQPPATQAPATQAPATQAPATQAPATQVPTPAAQPPPPTQTQPGGTVTGAAGSLPAVVAALIGAAAVGAAAL